MKRAMLYALLWCLMAGIFAFGIGHLLENEALKDGLIYTLVFPLFLVTRAVSGVVDLLGPSGRAEPASHYLSGGWAITLALLSLFLYWLSIALFILGGRKLWARWRRGCRASSDPADST